MNCIGQKKCVIFGRGTLYLVWLNSSPDEYLKRIRTIQASLGVWINPDNPGRTVALPSFLCPLWKPHLHKNPYRQKSGAWCLPSIQIRNWCYYLAGVTLIIWKSAQVWDVWCASGCESRFHPEHCLSSVLPAVSSLPTSPRTAASLDAPLWSDLLEFFDFRLFRIPHIPYFYHNCYQIPDS